MLQSRRFSYHCQILPLYSLETLPFLAADGITDFGIAQAKHYNLDFLLFRSTNRAIKNLF